MATVKLTASAYTRSNSNYMTVTNPSYMYDDTSDASNYATIRGRAGRSSNSTYYCYLHGFNFSAVPSNATVTGFTVKVKGYRNSYLSTGSSYRVRLTGSTTNSTISGTTCSSDWGTSATTLTIPTGSLTWSQIVNYGSGFSIQLQLRNSSTSSSNYPYLYIYGAEIEVTYTVPTTNYSVTVTNNTTDTESYTFPASTQQLTSGGSATVYIRGNLNDLSVKDNGVDVTSSLTFYHEESDGNDVYDAYGYTISNIQADHAVVIEHTSPQTTYTITAYSNDSHLSSGLRIEPLATGVVGSGRDAVVSIETTISIGTLYVYDNGTDVSSSVVMNSYTEAGMTYYSAYYVINDVSANHTVVFSRTEIVPTYTVSGTTSVQDTGLFAQYTSGGTTTMGSLPVDADEGTDVGILIYPTVEGADLTGITVTDNGVDVTSSIVYVQNGSGYYQYTISNIQAAHTLVVTRVTTYTVSASSTDPTLTVSVNNQGTSLDITVGQPAVIFIGGSDFTGLHATDNDVDVTSSLEYVASTGGGVGYPPRYKYEIAAVNETHTIVVSRVAASPVRVKQNGS